MTEEPQLSFRKASPRPVLNAQAGSMKLHEMLQVAKYSEQMFRM
jgi:hypothetical protein